MTNNKAIETKEEKKNSLATKDPIEQLKDFELFAKSYDLQNTGSSSEVAVTTCPVHYTSGIKDEFGDSPLIKAIIDKDDATAKYYIKTCTDIKVAAERGGYTPLHLSNSVEITNALIAAGADVNVKNDYSRTPLHFAKSAEIVNVLIASGADVNAKDNDGWTPLYWAKSVEIANVLVAAGADVNAKDNRDCTPLHFAKSAEIVNVLIGSGADVNAKDNYGWTPLCWAKSVEIANVLVAAGADVNAKAFSGKTALEQMCLYLEHPLCHQEATLNGELMIGSEANNQ